MANKDVKYTISLEDLFSKRIKRAEKASNSFEKSVISVGKKMTGVFAGAAVIGGLTTLGKKVVETTAEFQKFEAVLGNTLGSESEAQKAMQNIVDFASRTPFQVNELTGAFVKLTNQGFKPTMREMTSLGDLASSTGKGFDQLAEAIIDAQVGEFERLKEFGVRASKQGDKVTFTFKGVKKQVDFTQASIQKYILSLGKLQGVSGAMAKISKTTGGQISNLKDSLDQTFLALGKRLNPQISKSIGFMSKMVKGAERFVRVPVSKTLEDQRIKLNVLVNSLNDATISEKDRLAIIKQIEEISPKVAASIEREGDAYKVSAAALREFNTEQLNKIVLQKRTEAIQETERIRSERINQLNEVAAEIREEQIKLIDKIAKKSQKNALVASKVLSGEIKANDGINRNLAERVALEFKTIQQLAIQSGLRNDAARSQLRLTEEFSELVRLQGAVNKLGSLDNKLREDRLKLAKQLGIELGGQGKKLGKKAAITATPSPELQDTVTTIKAAAPKTFNINIAGNLVGEFTLESKNITEGATESGRIVAKELAKALADIQAVSS